MRVVVLGSVRVLDAPSTVPSGEIALRVLAVLAAEANQPVHPDRLADLVWPGSPRASGNSLQAHISRWRKALGAHRITFSPAGYALVLGSDELDALAFEKLSRAALEARADGSLSQSADLCERALSLWNGTPFAALGDDDCVRSRRVELQAIHDAVQLARLESLCEIGRFRDVVRDAVPIAEAEPWNEPVHRVLSRAHYGSGDQVAALRVLTDLETELRDELGLDLSTASQLLREQVLRQEPALDLVPTQPRESEVSAASVRRITDRIARLPEMTQCIVRAAAISGQAIDTANIGRALGIDGLTMAKALSPALTAGIIIRTDGGVRFSGAAIRETVAEHLPADEALSLHRQLGEAMLNSNGGVERIRRAADHLAAAASLDTDTALRSIDLDRRLARTSISRAQYVEAVHLLRRALASAAYVSVERARQLDQAELWLMLGEADQRSGNLDDAMTAYRTAARMPDVTEPLQVRCALAHEECSLHARRHRSGAHDPSIELLESALQVVGPDHHDYVELLASLGQALSFAGDHERATRLAEEAVSEARRSTDQETMARTLLRCLAVQDPGVDAARRFELAQEAVEVSQSIDADELALEALSAWVPEIMRVGRLSEAEQVISQIERLADVQGNILHRCKVPMWRAALALFARRYDEAEVLIEDFRYAGERDGYYDTARIHGFQSILLALGRGLPEQAAAILAGFDHDRAFEPWRAATLLVAHAMDDRATIRRVLVPWSARRFALSRPFAGVRTFCACLIAEVVAKHGDSIACQRLTELIRPGIGHHQVLGAGAALLDDAAVALKNLRS